MMLVCCSDMAKVLEAEEACTRRAEEAVSTAAFNAIVVAPTIATLLKASQELGLAAIEQELSYSAVLVLPVLTTTKAANDWYLAYRRYCIVAKKPKSLLILVGAALVDIAILWVLALF